MKEKIYHLGVKALIRNSVGKILLLKVNQTTFKNPTPQDYWDIPGGRVLNGHTIEETLHREIEEETGIIMLGSFKHVDTIISNIEIPLDEERKIGLMLSIYDCVIPDQKEIKLSSEHSEYSWFSPEEAALLLTCKYPTSFTDNILKKFITFSS